jgi:hypothetical protein
VCDIEIDRSKADVEGSSVAMVPTVHLEQVFSQVSEVTGGGFHDDLGSGAFSLVTGS